VIFSVKLVLEAHGIQNSSIVEVGAWGRWLAKVARCAIRVSTTVWPDTAADEVNISGASVSVSSGRP